MKRRTISELLIYICFAILIFTFPVSASEELETIIPLEEASGVSLPQAQIQMLSPFSLNIPDFSYVEQLDNERQQSIYEQLDQINDLTIYNSSKKFTVNLPEPAYFAGAVTSSNYKEDPNYRELAVDFAKATHAYIKDNPREFWIASFSFSITTTDLKNGYIAKVKVYPVAYYDGILDEINETVAQIQACAGEVSGKSRYERVRYIHDYICYLITYPSNSEAAYYHTIPCAWLDSYAHKGVCEAYSKSFAYVCELCGIDAISVTGGSRLDADGKVISTHMWNYVRMDDNRWYLVDCTWDDTSSGKLVYNYFLKGSVNSSYNHIPAGCFSSDASKQYPPFIYPQVTASDYPVAEPVITKSKEAITVQIPASDRNVEWGLIYISDTDHADDLNRLTDGRTQIQYLDLTEDGRYSYDFSDMSGIAIRAYAVYRTYDGEELTLYSQPIIL